MSNTEKRGGEPKLLFPGLGPFYEAVSDVWYPLLRLTAGGLMLIPGWQHFVTGSEAFAASLAKNGFNFGTPLAHFLIFLETVGATCVVLGLFTRFFSAAFAIQMAVIAFAVQWPRGFGSPTMFFLLWGIVFFAISLRGGGPYSLDRVIGKEL